MNKEELERTWKKILSNCLGDFDCMINADNPRFNDPMKGPRCSFLLQCQTEALKRQKERMGLTKR
jgi:hypothetical protein